MFDIITIGSATQDIFIESDKGKILNLKEITGQKNWLCFDYGSKIDIDQVAFDIGGGAVNTAVNFSNIGFNVAAIAKMGNDLNSKAISKRLKERNVSEQLIIKTDECNTGFSIILTSFEGDRTVLAHRGANAHIKPEDIPWEEIKKSKWLYIAPLSQESNEILDELANFVQKNNVYLAYNPGATSIQRGIQRLCKIISTAEVVVMNKEEASKVTGMIEKPETKYNSHGNDKKINNYIKELLIKLKSYNPKVVVVTDGKHGLYAYDGKIFYQAESFPAKVISTLGAGDAFSSTFVAGLIKFDWDVEKSIICASINAASIVQSFGAQSGFKNFDEIEKTCAEYPDFKVNKYKLEEL